MPCSAGRFYIVPDTVASDISCLSHLESRRLQLLLETYLQMDSTLVRYTRTSSRLYCASKQRNGLLGRSLQQNNHGSSHNPQLLECLPCLTQLPRSWPHDTTVAPCNTLLLLLLSGSHLPCTVVLLTACHLHRRLLRTHPAQHSCRMAATALEGCASTPAAELLSPAMPVTAALSPSAALTG
jgi:hypothetical protein